MIPENSNWVIKDSLLHGGLPNSQKHYNTLLNIGVNVFVNVMGKKEYTTGKHKNKFDYRLLKHPTSIQYFNFPITDKKIISDPETNKIVEIITSNIKKGKIVYVHCLGGHGRSGTVIGLVLHNIYPDMTYIQIIDKLILDKSIRKYKPTMISPQTASQFNQLHRIITTSDDIYFYEPSSNYYFLSNYYQDSKPLISFHGKTWPSSEHFYQYFKFISTTRGKEYGEIIRSAKTSNVAYCLGSIKQNKNGTVKLKGGRDNSIINPSNKEYKINNAFTEYKDVTIRDDWDNVKDATMMIALVLKFTQNKTLSHKLISTFPSKLFEFTKKDTYWATFYDNRGKNKLGKMLTDLRQCFIANEKKKLSKV
jgi:predicted NAD-dependent protein-ADP-ribosyltransferase YbiA (DUF1768 family)/protein-tyrosine phosphatase